MAAGDVGCCLVLLYFCGEAADPAPEGVTLADPEKQDSSALN